MNTKFENIYARCRARIRDYDKEGWSDELYDESEYDLLMASIDDFCDICTKDITDYDDELKEFNIELTRKEQSILALGMIIHWVEPYVFNSDALKNSMSTKDYSLFSPANLLEKMSALLRDTERQFREEMNNYSFRVNDVASLTQ